MTLKLLKFVVWSAVVGMGGMFFFAALAKIMSP